MKLAPIFTDHAVFQKGQPIKIFGEGRGTVKIEFLSTVTETVSEGDSWCITLPKCDSYGGPYTMDITLDGEQITLSDIYIGEVWIAAGQSNMEMPLFRTDYGLDEAKGCENSMVRLFTVPRRVKRDTVECGWNFEPTDGEDKPWQICCEESALHFSAIGYYVAKELSRSLNCCVGMISCNWGGKPIEVFIGKQWIKEAPFMKSYYDEQTRLYSDWSPEDFEKNYKDVHEACVKRCVSHIDVVDMVRKRGVAQSTGFPTGIMPVIPEGPYNPNHNMGILYDSMYSRIIPYGIKGILWYQGESNVPEGYLDKYRLYMKCMRESFENSELSFYAVELASYATGQHENGNIISDRYVDGGGNWAYKREMQQMATEAEPNNYLVTTMGIGDPYDIHPTNKKTLSERMSKKILKHSYGFGIKADQPVFKRATLKGDTVTVELENSEGLFSQNLSAVNIYLTDESHVMKKASVRIKDDTLILSCPEIPTPSEVRYAFDNYYGGGLIYNSAYLPLAPFRAILAKEEDISD